MSDTSSRLSLPYILPSQAQKHVTHNEAVRRLDALVQPAALSAALTAAPADPAAGDCYLVAGPATGAWAGQEDSLAVFQDGVWVFIPPAPGWTLRVIDTARTLAFDGTAWDAALAGAARFGVNATADSTNRLTAAAPATLLTHEGADHRLKINKAAEADTASVLYQAGFTGHAEMGLMGGRNFSFKVSPDGSAWADALTIDAATADLGVGTAAPLQRLHMAGDRPILRIEDSTNPLGSGARSLIQFYDQNGRVGFVGFNSASNKHLSLNADDAGSDIRIQGPTTEITVAASGGVGIGTTNPTVDLEVAGDIQCTSLLETSDARLKRAVAPAGEAGAVLDAIEVVRFDWKETGGHVPFGLIAQDLAAVLPQAVRVGDGAQEFGVESTTWALRPGPLLAALIAEVKSLRIRLAALEAPADGDRDRDTGENTGENTGGDGDSPG